MHAERPRIADLPAEQRPRERLRRLGPDALTDAEVVAILIGSGRPGTNVLDLAGRLIARVGGIGGLSGVTVEAIETVAGLGPAAASRIVAATELRRRAALAAPRRGASSTSDIAAAVVPHLQDRHRECMVVAVTDRRLRVLEVVAFPEGTAGHADAPIPDILRTVLARGGHAFALAHNHPGGTLTPSREDRDATTRMRAGAQACGLRFLDHLIVAGETWRAID